MCALSYLNSSFCQINLHCEVLTREHIGVMRLRERTLQFLQLLQRECGAIPPLFAPHERVVMNGGVVGVTGVCKTNICQL